MNFRLLFLLFLSQTISCVSGVKENTPKPKPVETQQAALLLKDGKPVVFDSAYDAQLDSIEDESMIRLIELHDCSKFYCQRGPKTYRQSYNGRYFIEYDRKSAVNSLFSNSNPEKPLGSIKLQVNNPEFGITTIPLEDEPGILLTDGVYGFTKYELKNGKFIKAFQIKFDKKGYRGNFVVLGGQNQLLVYKRDDSGENAGVDFYALEDGKLVDSKSIDGKYYTMEYLVHDNLVAFKHPENLLIKDELCTTTLFEVKSKIHNETHIASRTNKGVIGLIRNKDGLTHFNSKEQNIEMTKYTMQENTFPHQMFATKDYICALYFEKDKNNPNYKISKQGLIVFSKETNTISHLTLPTYGVTTISSDIEGKLFAKIRDSYFSVSLDKLSKN